MITIMGASGQTGGKIAQTLLQAGEKVRLISRSAGKLAAFGNAGAEIVIGDAADPAFLTSAFQGAAAVYTLVAADPTSADYRATQDQLGQAIAEAIRASGVKHVVALSSLGADHHGSMGVIAGLRAQEERLQQIPGLNVLLLRPASFYENFQSTLPLIKQEGICGDALAADVPMPMVATRDIATVAARALRARDWSGIAVRELLGPRDITCAEIARILGARLGKPDLAYVQFSEADTISSLVGVGLSETFARLYVEMTRAMNAQQLQPRNGRTAENTTPTRFEDYADELARAYAAL
jgi:uncharacterized protein YbjT (DUF2867 family)